MKYICLIYGEEKKQGDMPEAEAQEVGGEYMEFTKDIKSKGKMVAGDALQATSTATTVRVRDGKTTKTHGPFAETREQLGGYYLIDAKDLDEACAIAERVPPVRYGTIEIRPVMAIPGLPASEANP